MFTYSQGLCKYLFKLLGVLPTQCYMIYNSVTVFIHVELVSTRKIHVTIHDSYNGFSIMASDCLSACCLPIRIYVCIMISSNGNIFCVTGPFVRKIHRSPMDSLHKRPVVWSFDIFFDLRLSKRMSKQSGHGDLRCHHTHYDVTEMEIDVNWYGFHYTFSSFMASRI